MEIYKNQKVIHYPSLRTVLMVEQVLKDAELAIDREELKRRLPVQIMHQTLNVILRYLEDKGMIIDGHKGVLWIYNTPMKKNIKEIIKIILPIIKKYGIKKAGIFGSYARGEEREDSDIDILIEFKGKKSLVDLVNLELLLKKVLNKKVDLLTYNSINPLLKEKILKEEVRII